MKCLKLAAFPFTSAMKSNLLFMLVLGLSACRMGGTLTADGTAITADTTPSVNIPTTTLTSPYYSNASTLNLTGLCKQDTTVHITGDSNQTTPCGFNSTYSFSITKTNDAVYAFSITQIDTSGKASPANSFVWVRKTTLAAPTITTLNSNSFTNPYYSGGSSLALAGTCEYGTTLSYTISPGSNAPTSFACTTSSYQFSVNAGADQNYTISITETDAAQNSTTITTVWNKKILSTTPNGTLTMTLGQGSPATVNLQGGSGQYQLVNTAPDNSTITSTLTTSDPVNTPAVYTFNPPGHLAGNYTLVFSDTKDSSSGTVTLIATALAGTADHFALVAPTPTAVGYGKIHATPFQIKVLDQFNNPVGGYSVLFNLMTGDGKILNKTTVNNVSTYSESNGIVTSDVSGIASVYIQNGQQFLNSRFVARCGGSASCTLPDAASSGNASLAFTTPTISSPSIWNFGQSFQGGSGTNSSSAATFISGRFNNTGPGTKGDIAVISFTPSNSPVLMVYVGKGNGLFQAPVTYNIPASCKISSTILQLQAADFDGDGNQDLAILCSGNNNQNLKPIAIARGIGDGSFTNTTSGNNKTLTLNLVGPAMNDGTLNLAAFTAADLNGDGKVDLAYVFSTASQSATITAYSNAPCVTVLLSTSTSGNFTFASGSVYPLLVSSAPTVLTAANLHSTYSPSNSGLDLIVGDFVADNNAAYVGVLKNIGNGTFPQTIDAFGSNTAYKIFATDPNATGINTLYVKDLDADGKPDVVAGNGGSTSATVFIGDGNLGSASLGFNASPTTLTLNDIPSSITTLDLNQNGNLNIVVGTTSGISLILQNTKDTFTVSGSAFTNSALNTITSLDTIDPSLTGTAATIPSLVSFGNDGGSANILQVMAVNSNTAKTFGLSYALPSTQGGKTFTPKKVVKTDFNNHLINDLAILSLDTNGSQNGIISFFKGMGDGSFTQVKQNNQNFTISFLSNETPIAMAFADLDGDGINDLVVITQANKSVNLYKGNGDGTFTVQGSPLITAIKPTDIALGDLNHDGKVDIIVSTIGSTAQAASDKQISVLMNQTSTGGSMSFAAHADYSFHGGGANSIILQDFNNDGNLDVVTVNADGTLSIAYSNPSGTLNPDINLSALSISTTPFTTPIAAGNFFGHTDGTLDLAVLNQDASTTLLINSTSIANHLPFGQTTNPQATLALGGGSSLLAGDFTGTGYIDLISTISSFNLTLSYAHNTPALPQAGKFATPNLYEQNISGFDNQSAQSSVINTLITGDFDGNGSVDFIVLDSTNNQFQVWLSQ